jgi:GNAT superfamily N-acetyltransferase
LRLVYSVAGQAARRRFLKMLVELHGSGRLAAEIPDYHFKLVRCADANQALSIVKKSLASEPPCPVIVISDLLVELSAGALEDDTWSPSNWAKEVQDELQGRGAVIAVVDRSRRVRDIDRTLSRSASPEQLLATIKLVADKLTYMARPAKRSLGQSVTVRLIRRQHELMEYFKLRHRIYRIMGYLDEPIENAPSQMEIDWCDRISLHVGAFEQGRDAQERLVGTARVVIGAAPGGTDRTRDIFRGNWVVKLAASDPVLSHVVNNRVLELELPIFHSQNLSGIFRDTILHNEVCGELSRVIVAEDHRGTGLSSQLVEFAMAEAVKVGVQRLFLECLELHEPVYGKHGFKRLAGSKGAVLGVNQTMIGMERCPLVAASAAQASAVGQVAVQPTGATANV